jgi:hypothetical protein
MRRRLHVEDWFGLSMAVLIVLLVAFCVAGLLDMSRQIKACEASGGRVEEYGDPIYVQSGSIMVPVRNSRCVR